MQQVLMPKSNKTNTPDAPFAIDQCLCHKQKTKIAPTADAKTPESWLNWAEWEMNKAALFVAAISESNSGKSASVCLSESSSNPVQTTANPKPNTTAQTIFAATLKAAKGISKTAIAMSPKINRGKSRSRAETFGKFSKSESNETKNANSGSQPSTDLGNNSSEPVAIL